MNFVSLCIFHIVCYLVFLTPLVIYQHSVRRKNLKHFLQSLLVYNVNCSSSSVPLQFLALVYTRFTLCTTIVLLLENKGNKNCIEHQIPILCWNLTDLKFNFNFVTYVWALRVIHMEHAESTYAHRFKYPSSCTEAFRTVDIKYKSEVNGRFCYYISMPNFMKILSALL